MRPGRVTRVRDELRSAWRASDAIFALLGRDESPAANDAALAARPIALRHPFCFYVGHLPAFAHNQVAVGLLHRPPLHAGYSQLFEFGIDPLSSDETTTEQWPEMSEIRGFRDAARAEVLDLVAIVAELPDTDPLAAGGRIFDVVLEHELMHQETLLYMAAQLEHATKRRPVGYRLPAPRPVPPQQRLRIPAGAVSLGAALPSEGLVWDNETPPWRVDVRAFTIDRYPVSNADFARFVDAGGYRMQRCWAPDSWAWIHEQSLEQPATWVGGPADRRVRALFEDVAWAVAACWPAQVSHAEATAYARFVGGRLPTEPELRRAALTAPEGQRRFPWGDDPVDADRANAGLQRWTPTPIGSHPAGGSAWGIEDAYGDGWEWTSSDWQAQPGFRPWIRTYPGYSADFFDGQHRAMFGASWATPQRLLRSSFRNWFQRHYPWVFSKFRVARDR